MILDVKMVNHASSLNHHAYGLQIRGKKSQIANLHQPSQLLRHIRKMMVS
ncbi:MAG: hypothetical protein Q8N05_09840 [Bacteroidota bacterium]|nr:hypothetical protein [Bacteroidota bacterium]